MQKSKCSCILCKQEIDISNIFKHFDSDQCKRRYKPNRCEYCNKPCFKRFCSLKCSGVVVNKNPKGYSLQKFHQVYISCVQCKKCIRTQDFHRHNCNTKNSKKSHNKNSYRYETRFNFSLKEFDEWFSYCSELILKFGMYHPVNNPSGYSRDHMISVSYGEIHKIDPNLISHPANCELISHLENQRKRTKSKLSVHQLLERISVFEMYYPNWREGRDSNP